MLHFGTLFDRHYLTYQLTEMMKKHFCRIMQWRTHHFKMVNQIYAFSNQTPCLIIGFAFFCGSKKFNGQQFFFIPQNQWKFSEIEWMNMAIIVFNNKQSEKSLNDRISYAHICLQATKSNPLLDQISTGDENLITYEKIILWTRNTCPLYL